MLVLVLVLVLVAEESRLKGDPLSFYGHASVTIQHILEEGAPGADLIERPPITMRIVLLHPDSEASQVQVDKSLGELSVCLCAVPRPQPRDGVARVAREESSGRHTR